MALQNTMGTGPRSKTQFDGLDRLRPFLRQSRVVEDQHPRFRRVGAQQALDVRLIERLCIPGCAGQVNETWS